MKAGNQVRNSLADFTVLCGWTGRSSHRRFSVKKLFLKSSQYPQETPVLESLFKNVADLKAWNFIKKRPQNRCSPVNIAKCLILLISKIIGERLRFGFFNGSLLHRPKGWRSRLYDGVGLQGLTHRSSFLLLSWDEPSLSSRPTFENLRGIPLMSQLSFYIDKFWS